ncbi:anibiotic ABC transporter efflux pump [Lipingzhangella sp. LS1_29]|uniref:Anibiotic ABC transporter efflux pump n=1 Tax=Lipingzhangella rawalii TaxID=2055835 RepID=A0ABU2H4F7_9ACTN|nr:anibiotic ABC transporter efflux pump [Lipingzhangella rawalii]MDS1269882.1 anibiotic ABC transporter efflux pump [Lipingzhangella rawalii]
MGSRADSPVATPERETTAVAPRRPADAFAGTGTLIRFQLRRDRLRIPVWLVAITATVVGSAASFTDIFQDDAEIAARIALLQGNPAGIALTGPGYGLAEASTDTIGPLIANELSATTIILVALMGIFLAVRHTRGEEESGRAELVRAGVVGRHAAITATLAVVGGSIVLLGALLGLGLAAVGMPWTGSMAFGVSMAGLGLVCTALALVFAQITEYARAAVGLSCALFAVAFAVRAAGDVADNVLVWYSPVGWTQALRPYAQEEWWPLLPLVGLALALAACAYALNVRRDFGSGLLRPRPGRARARAWLVSPLGLVFRQQRAGLLGWGATMVAFGLFGGVLSGEAEQLREIEFYENFVQFDAAALDQAMFGFYFLFLAMVAGGYTLQTLLRVRGAEHAGGAEAVLATAVSRWHWLGAHVLVALLGSAALLAVAGLAAGTVYAIQQADLVEIPRLVGAQMVHLPALAVLVGLATFLYGWWPRLSPLVWAVLGYSFLVWMFGPLLDLPQWMMDASPFLHVAELPHQDLEWAPVLALSGLALALVAGGLFGFRRRDIQPD